MDADLRSSAPGTRCADATRALEHVLTVTAAAGDLARLVEGAAAWPADARRDLLARLDRVVDGLSTIRAAVLLAERASGAWQGGGDRSFASWRARTGLTGERAAGSHVRQAEHLAAVPVLAAAVAQGQIALEHATTIGRVAASGTPAQQAAVSSPETQDRLMRLAQQQDATTFATTVATMAATVDPDGLERDHGAQRRARYVHLSHTSRGTFLKGQLDSTAGHRLQLALEALSPRPGADDDRDPGQRRADALETMAGQILSSADTRPGAHVPPHVSLILTEATWHAARAERDRRRGAAAGDRGTAVASGTPGRTDTAVAGYEPATLEDGTPVPPSELARAMCDCDVTRIAVDADGAPLDLGRTQRLLSGAQRRAVIARDRECAWPSCHQPARWCDIHHIRWWERDDGPTSVELGALLCVYHHHEVHRRDLAITRCTDPPEDGSVASPAVAGRSAARSAPRTSAESTARSSTAAAPTSGAARRLGARYEFRDPTGRLVGQPPSPVGGSRERPGSPTAPPPSPSPTPTVRVPMPVPSPPPLEWGTDPVTGMRVPAFLLGPDVPPGPRAARGAATTWRGPR